MKKSNLHTPVLLDEVISSLRLFDKNHIIDATFGNGGYSSAILNSSKCFVTAFDRDPEAILRGKELLKKFKNRFSIFESCFSGIKKVLEKTKFKKADGIVFDLGVCSTQLDNANRGFSFRHNGPLDMRMSKIGIKAEDVVNESEEKKLSKIFWEFGEERKSKKIARAIINYRKKNKIKTTGELKDIIHSVFPKPVFGKPDNATKTFQALRIYINNELEELEKGMINSESILNQNGIISVVSFHSLEDRIVKKFLKLRSFNSPNPSRYLPITNKIQPTFKIITKKPILPSEQEIRHNYRSRSAKLRVAERTAALPYFCQERKK